MAVSILLLSIVAMVLPIYETRQHWDRRFCKDEESYSTCNFWNRLGACKYEAYFPMLAEKCPKTCNLCTFNLGMKPDTCNDKKNVGYCQSLKDFGACENYADLMAEDCAHTCKLCDAKRKCAEKQCKYNEVCVLDENREPQCTCPNYCANKKSYQKLGKICGSDGKTYKDFCHLQHHACRENNNITVTKYGICDKDIPCEDNALEKDSGMCDSWKNAGLCTDRSEIMLKYCKRTCGHCDKRIPFQRLRGDCDKKDQSPFGCCWDLSFRPDPRTGKRCPACRDTYKFCDQFIKECKTPTNKKFMKEKCPVTCGYCAPEEKPQYTLKFTYEFGKKVYKPHRQFSNKA